MRNKTKIVIVDENRENRKQAALLLADGGYEVAEFPTTRETLLELRRSGADAVLLDLDTNEIQGTDIIREAKAGNPEVSVILMGTKGAIESNPNLLLFGGYEYLLKPLNGEVLRSAIEQRLHQQHIYRICSTLSAANGVDDTLSLILETALNETESSHGAILLKNGSDNSLHIKAAKGFPEQAIGSVHALDEAGIMKFIFDNGEPIVVQGGFAQLPFIPEHLLSQTGPSVCAPIRIGGETFGMLNISRPPSDAPFSQSDLRMIEIISLQAAVAINNARTHRHALERQKMRQELDLARSIQQSLLPVKPPCEQWAEVVSRSVPAQMIGGDFFDFIESGPDRLGVVIGDVTGKGVPGALLMVRALCNFRLRVGPDKPPGKVLEELNNDLVLHSTRGVYVTALYAVFDFRRRSMLLANAGHPSPFLRGSITVNSGLPDMAGGIPLGIMPDASFETIEMPLESGDLVFFFTDGIPEARNSAKDEFSLGRLEILLDIPGNSVRQIADRVLGELISFTAGRPQHDDITLVAIKLNQHA